MVLITVHLTYVTAPQVSLLVEHVVIISAPNVFFNALFSVFSSCHGRLAVVFVVVVVALSRNYAMCAFESNLRILSLPSLVRSVSSDLCRYIASVSFFPRHHLLLRRLFFARRRRRSVAAAVYRIEHRWHSSDVRCLRKKTCERSGINQTTPRHTTKVGGPDSRRQSKDETGIKRS